MLAHRVRIWQVIYKCMRNDSIIFHLSIFEENKTCDIPAQNEHTRITIMSFSHGTMSHEPFSPIGFTRPSSCRHMYVCFNIQLIVITCMNTFVSRTHTNICLLYVIGRITTLIQSGSLGNNTLLLNEQFAIVDRSMKHNDKAKCSIDTFAHVKHEKLLHVNRTAIRPFVPCSIRTKLLNNF